MSMVSVESTGGRAPSRILHDPLPGTGYRALRRLGGGVVLGGLRGGRATTAIRRAVKVLRSVFVDAPDAVFRLEQEGRALAALDHPSLVPVLDVGTTATGRPFFVMPLLEGETVRDRLRRRGPDRAGARRVRHRRSRCSRGSTPRTAAASCTATSSRRTSSCRRAARPRGRGAACCSTSASPSSSARPARPRPTRASSARRATSRRSRSSAGRVDARTDVYAAGLTLFEMIAGRGPFEGEGPIDLMRAHVEARRALPARPRAGVARARPRGGPRPRKAARAALALGAGVRRRARAGARAPSSSACARACVSAPGVEAAAARDVETAS